MGLPGVDYQALLRKYLAFLIDQYGDDYFDEALHLVDTFPALDPMEMAAFQDVVNEVLRERGLATATVRRGLC